jgi:hypothetical protein
VKPSETLAEIQTVITEYWASVDRVPVIKRPAASFFVDYGEMVLGSLAVRGRQQLDEFFQQREAREIANQRTTRHTTSNFRIEEEGEGRVMVRALVLVYSGVGEWPLPVKPPSAVGDFTFRCIHDGSRGWMFTHVTGNSIFVGADAPKFAKKST